MPDLQRGPDWPDRIRHLHLGEQKAPREQTGGMDALSGCAKVDRPIRVLRCRPLPKEMSVTRPDPATPEAPSRVPPWLRRAILIGAMLFLGIALAGFVVFSLRAVTFD